MAYIAWELERKFRKLNDFFLGYTCHRSQTG